MSGKLGSADLVAATNTQIGAALPTDAVVNVCFVNRSSSQVTIRLAISPAAGAPGAADYLEYEQPLAGNGGVLERTGIACSQGEVVNVQASGSGVSCRAHYLPSA